MVVEKPSPGSALVPRNIICSKKWARPDMPGGSSTAPTLNHSIWVATGARRSGITSTCMPLARANWKVLLPVWRTLAGAGWDSLARLAELSSCTPAGAGIPNAAITQAAPKSLEPVKPAAALFFLGPGGCRRLAALGDFGIGIHRLAVVGRGAGGQQAVGEAAVGILDRGTLGGIQAGAAGGGE